MGLNELNINTPWPQNNTLWLFLFSKILLLLSLIKHTSKCLLNS
jgi:hypothetical protein